MAVTHPATGEENSLRCSDNLNLYHTHSGIVSQCPSKLTLSEFPQSTEVRHYGVLPAYQKEKRNEKDFGSFGIRLTRLAKRGG